ncbi:MAG: N-acetylmannosamine-6-phosphate 2-epimerase [Limnoraphis robusta]|uniref:Putative N-acetylmannosamine-6-phosphate 2-epimerase n=2 Tax=Limnoraphis robusta TaxID=1118279 RepID=A0A0F5YG65_9CYAN|nr:N-acetylmannosamine-6-phosphate 2-epimerase [Limnoraphis robusta]KKD37205.1 acetylmannosamine-6-phosphate 2-epimerase [Limnoraphis robusta CS-951]MEA5500549.1 N-acetylmannosamine-6-phosphate 2-epimerase [Limnoraphis robusta BA-68 BA1]MEA5518653.1 N-acetylmannosamine-6-phosphate 2-epimerase [Limnoraphis robusta CCNP1315]MEA5543244.1 N-acetylmannosamine-6-phosphate 2-epimerase [Limnoraphis robusta Tam1]MEA5548481.1 N-acetylmannosamine-6-phosphate 2-epimerase [Limnoraphis robusta CCNP1324]
MAYEKNLIPPQSLIVSCQAPVDSPLHHPIVIAAMAKAAINQGAVGVRVDTPNHVKAVREAITQPIIGLWKQQIPGFEVYITPRFADAVAIAEAGADIIAIDGTLRNRPNGETLKTLIPKIQQELGKQVMADIDTLEAAIEAASSGADFVGTTLYSYTKATENLSPPGFDLLEKMVQKLEVPVICEGGISSPEQAKKAIKLGATAVVVGTAITGIDIQVKNYQTALLTQSRG